MPEMKTYIKISEKVALNETVERHNDGLRHNHGGIHNIPCFEIISRGSLL